MALIRTGYVLQFEEICPGSPAYGRATLLPWDTEFFGFPAASYQIGAESVAPLDTDALKELREKLSSWLHRHQVAVCSCVVPATDSLWKRYLTEMDFRLVDIGLQVSLSNLQKTSLPEARAQLRLAERGDWDAIEAIAAHSFHHGRYHADPLFPRELADGRYQQWVRNALTGEQEVDRVYVMGDPGDVQGFYHVTMEDGVSDMRLAAVRPELQGTLFGFELYLALLHTLQQAGIRRVITSISAANTSVINIYGQFGFRFGKPEAIYHWHAEE
jgi:GNAT superfamily N-acetyltransferase